MPGTLGRANLALAAITLMVSGCLTFKPYDPGPGRRVAASVPEAVYLPGQPINITIVNLSEVELIYPDGFCKTELQRKDRGGWVTVSGPVAACPVEKGFLDPSQAVVHQFRLPRNVEGGLYRLAIPMPVPEDPNTREADLITPSFAIQGTQSDTKTVTSGMIQPN